MTDDELDLVETTRLADALYRRVGATGGAIIAMVQDRTATQEYFQCYYRGGLTIAIGLAERAAGNFKDDCAKFND